MQQYEYAAEYMWKYIHNRIPGPQRRPDSSDTNTTANLSEKNIQRAGLNGNIVQWNLNKDTGCIISYTKV